MGQLIHFEERAVARLRERLGAVEETNEDLIAFARGHWGAVASIHAAALAAVQARSIEALLDSIACDWPRILGIDSAAVGLVVGTHGFRADRFGIERIEAGFVDRLAADSAPVEVRSVVTGHPLFGASTAAKIRAEALIRIDCGRPFPSGLLVLGQHAPLEFDSSHGSELLLFLGRIVAATVRRAVDCA